MSEGGTVEPITCEDCGKPRGDWANSGAVKFVLRHTGRLVCEPCMAENFWDPDPQNDPPSPLPRTEQLGRADG